MKVRRNDTVLVIAGKDLGKRGKVDKVNPKDGRIIVQGVNIIKRHTRPRPPARQGGIVEREAAIHISNVMVICTKCEKPTRVSFRTLESGTKVRQCRRCGEEID